MTAFWDTRGGEKSELSEIRVAESTARTGAGCEISERCEISPADPRSDFADDSALWTRLLTLAYQWDADDPRGLYGALHCFRIDGARLEEREGRLFIRSRPAPEGGWADEPAFQAEREQWLVPHAVALVRLLKAVQEGMTTMPWWLRLECAGEGVGQPAAEVTA